MSGKVALITGGSRGIGKAIASAYADAGASVFICARNLDELKNTAAEIRKMGAEIHEVAGDIGNASDAARIVRAAIDHYGTIDVLVNNASHLGPRVPLSEYPLSSWDEVIRINLTGVFIMTQAVVKVMIRQRQGSIINVSSGVGRVGKARWGAYAVSKFGVEGITQVLAEEVKPVGIRVNAVNPGGTRTEMRAEAYPDEDPLTLPTPDEITEAFLYLASDESLNVTGQSHEARDWLKRRN